MRTLTVPQQAVLKDRARVRIVAGSRRSGKSTLEATLCIGSAQAGGEVFWFFPSRTMCEAHVRRVSEGVAQTNNGAERRQFTFPSGGRLWLMTYPLGSLSAALIGYWPSLVVIDEAAYIPSLGQPQVMHEMLSGFPQTHFVLVGTPRAEDEESPDPLTVLWNKAPAHGWSRHYLPNAFVAPDQLAQAWRQVSYRHFLSEYVGLPRPLEEVIA